VSARKAKPRRPPKKRRPGAGGRPRGTAQVWWQTLLRHEKRDLPILNFILRMRLNAPRTPMWLLVARAAERFHMTTRTVERKVALWNFPRSLPQGRLMAAQMAQAWHAAQVGTYFRTQHKGKKKPPAER
jgi:hypothetical protein